VRPAGPEPMTAIFLPVEGRRTGFGCFLQPFSAAIRLSMRMATGPSNWFREHFASQGCAQAYPQTKGKGIFSRTTARASSKRPSRTNRT